MTDEHSPAARVHLSVKAGGHWWDEYDAEPPDWYADYLHARTVVNEAPQRCESVPTPDVPDPVPWTEYRNYACAGCGWPCIEHQDSDAAEADRCWYCLQPDASLPDGRELVRTPDRAVNSDD